ncbi:hypothetical protein IAT38_000664 [Cryptococcus sp. DSM 104549]
MGHKAKAQKAASKKKEKDKKEKLAASKISRQPKPSDVDDDQEKDKEHLSTTAGSSPAVPLINLPASPSGPPGLSTSPTTNANATAAATAKAQTATVITLDDPPHLSHPIPLALPDAARPSIVGHGPPPQAPKSYLSGWTGTSFPGTARSVTEPPPGHAHTMSHRMQSAHMASKVAAVAAGSEARYLNRLANNPEALMGAMATLGMGVASQRDLEDEFEREEPGYYHQHHRPIFVGERLHGGEGHYAPPYHFSQPGRGLLPEQQLDRDDRAMLRGYNPAESGAAPSEYIPRRMPSALQGWPGDRTKVGDSWVAGRDDVRPFPGGGLPGKWAGMENVAADLGTGAGRAKVAAPAEEKTPEQLAAAEEKRKRDAKKKSEKKKKQRKKKMAEKAEGEGSGAEDDEKDGEGEDDVDEAVIVKVVPPPTAADGKKRPIGLGLGGESKDANGVVGKDGDQPHNGNGPVPPSPFDNASELDVEVVTPITATAVHPASSPDHATPSKADEREATTGGADPAPASPDRSPQSIEANPHPETPRTASPSSSLTAISPADSAYTAVAPDSPAGQGESAQTQVDVELPSAGSSPADAGVADANAATAVQVLVAAFQLAASMGDAFNADADEQSKDDEEKADEEAQKQDAEARVGEPVTADAGIDATVKVDGEDASVGFASIASTSQADLPVSELEAGKGENGVDIKEDAVKKEAHDSESSSLASEAKAAKKGEDDKDQGSTKKRDEATAGSPPAQFTKSAASPGSPVKLATPPGLPIPTVPHALPEKPAASGFNTLAPAFTPKSTYSGRRPSFVAAKLAKEEKDGEADDESEVAEDVVRVPSMSTSYVKADADEDKENEADTEQSDEEAAKPALVSEAATLPVTEAESGTAASAVIAGEAKPSVIVPAQTDGADASGSTTETDGETADEAIVEEMTLKENEEEEGDLTLVPVVVVPEQDSLTSPTSGSSGKQAAGHSRRRTVTSEGLPAIEEEGNESFVTAAEVTKGADGDGEEAGTEVGAVEAKGLKTIPESRPLSITPSVTTPVEVSQGDAELVASVQPKLKDQAALTIDTAVASPPKSPPAPTVTTPKTSPARPKTAATPATPKTAVSAPPATPGGTIWRIPGEQRRASAPPTPDGFEKHEGGGLVRIQSMQSPTKPSFEGRRRRQSTPAMLMTEEPTTPSNPADTPQGSEEPETGSMGRFKPMETSRKSAVEVRRRLQSTPSLVTAPTTPVALPKPPSPSVPAAEEVSKFAPAASRSAVTSPQAALPATAPIPANDASPAAASPPAAITPVAEEADTTPVQDPAIATPPIPPSVEPTPPAPTSKGPTPPTSSHWTTMRRSQSSPLPAQVLSYSPTIQKRDDSVPRMSRRSETLVPIPLPLPMSAQSGFPQDNNLPTPTRRLGLTRSLPPSLPANLRTSDAPNQHFLSHKWTLYYSGPPEKGHTSMKQYNSGLVQCFSGRTLEDVFGGWKALRRAIAVSRGRDIEPPGEQMRPGEEGLGTHFMPDETTFHLFRDDIRPMWEDGMCTNGGKIMFATGDNSHLLTDKMFLDMFLLLINGDLDDLVERPTNPRYADSIVCGVVISRRKLPRVEIWLGGKNGPDSLWIKSVGNFFQERFEVGIFSKFKLFGYKTFRKNAGGSG